MKVTLVRLRIHFLKNFLLFSIGSAVGKENLEEIRVCTKLCLDNLHGEPV